MACAALAAVNLGLDKTQAKLVADDRLDAHVIGTPSPCPLVVLLPGHGRRIHPLTPITLEIEVTGPETPGYGEFKVVTVRSNPAPPGAVTGQATYGSFLSSLLRAHGRGKGFHFC